MILPIVTHGHSALTTKAEPVIVFDDHIATLCKDLMDTCRAAGGVGLAANQVAVLKRVIAIDSTAVSKPSWMFSGRSFMDARSHLPIVLVNPEIQLCPITENGVEGCLSIPSAYETVKRAQMIYVSAQTFNGNSIEFSCGGWLARVIQHEVDHLDGKSFFDLLTPDKRAALIKKYQRSK